MKKERKGHYYTVTVMVWGPSYDGDFDLRAH